MIKTLDLTNVMRVHQLSIGARHLYYILLGKCDSNGVAPVNLGDWATSCGTMDETLAAWRELESKDLVRHDGNHLILHGYHAFRGRRKPVVKYPIPRELIDVDNGFSVLREVELVETRKKYSLDAPIQRIVSAYNNILATGTDCKPCPLLSKNKQNKLNRRWLEDRERQSIEYWEELFTYIKMNCPFLTDVSVGHAWTLDLGWLVEEDNFVKVISGIYDTTKEKFYALRS